MKIVTRNVAELDRESRRILEWLLGRGLADDELVAVGTIVNGAAQEIESGAPVTNGNGKTPMPLSAADRETLAVGRLPEWFNVFDGLSEPEKDELQAEISNRGNGSSGS